MAKTNVFGLCGYGELTSPVDLDTYAPYGIKAYDITFHWKNINPAKNTFNFTDFDSKILTLANAGYYITFKVLIAPWGENVPSWANSVDGIPEVTCTGSALTFPYYFNANMKAAHRALLLAIANHLVTLPSDVKDKIYSWQICEGSTGDTGPYKGTPVNPAYRITDAEWSAYKKTELWPYFKSVNEQNSGWVKLMFNAGNDGEDLYYVNSNFDQPAHKDGWLAHQYNFNGEVSYFNRQFTFVNSLYLSFRSRAEVQGFGANPYWKPAKDGFTLVWSALAGGLDMMNLPIGSMDELPLEAALYFNKYGNQRNPLTVTKAAIQLADKIDFADTARFPEDGTYHQLITPGKEKQYNNQIAAINANTSYSDDYKDWLRWQKIINFLNPARKAAILAANPNATEGASEFDYYNQDYVIGGVKNYEKFITQINPDSTSVGGYRLGDEDDIHGRFARGFKITGDSAPNMQFKINSYLGNGARKTNAKFTITYHDNGTGSWGLYCVKCYQKKQILSVTNEDSGLMKQVEVSTKIKLGNVIDSSADFELKYSGGDNTFFPLIEFQII